MPLLDKASLLRRILDGLTAAGWSIDSVSRSHPFKVLTAGPHGQEALVCYVWNVTHGGRTRSTDEYRIQVTGVSKLAFEEAWTTLLLGVAEVSGTPVLAAFDASKHSTFGASPSIQVSEQTLLKAVQGGVAFEEKRLAAGKTEFVVAFRPEMLDQYLLHIQPHYHSADMRIPAPERGAVASLDFTQRHLSNAVLGRIPPARRRALRETFVQVRDRTFRERVLQVYGHRCAVCGLQADLVQGCHIVAVRDAGLDDVRNGIALCASHHVAYDQGLIEIHADYSIRANVSRVEKLRAAHLDAELDAFLISARVGETIYLPVSSEHHPHPESLRRHLDSPPRRSEGRIAD